MTASTAPTSGPVPVRTRAPGPDERRVLVLVGGLPGAGKTRLLGRLLASAPGARGLDSEQVAAALRRRGVRLPYRLLRPLVHGLHRVRAWAVLRGGDPVVVLTDPLTSPRRRRSLLRVARRSRREVRLVLLDAAPEEARRGQRDRRRVIGPRAMTRHVRRWRTALAELRAPGGAPGAAVLVVDRSAAGELTLARLLAG
jgi:predicted kinase